MPNIDILDAFKKKKLLNFDIDWPHDLSTLETAEVMQWIRALAS